MSNDYNVILPADSFKEVHRTYQDLAEACMQWLVSENPDDHNNAEVIFCRGCDFPESGQKIGYPSYPAMMVGDRALNILNTQYLFLPVVFTTATDIEDRAGTVQERSYVAWRDTMVGDSPPLAKQILIDGKPIDLPNQKQDLSDFLVYTRDFTLNIPNAPYGKSLRDYFDIPMTTPGNRQAMIGGYFVLFRFEQPGTQHTLAFEARGVLGPRGQYFASGLYTINVLKADAGNTFGSQDMRSKEISKSFKDMMRARIEYKKETGQLGDSEYKKLTAALT
jgi:hypothetical protein